MSYHMPWLEEKKTLLSCALTHDEVTDMLFEHTQEVKTPAALGRHRDLSMMHVCLAIISTLMGTSCSQLEVWRTLCLTPLFAFDLATVTDQTAYNTIHVCAPSMQALFLHVSAALRSKRQSRQDEALAPFATRVLALDESTLDSRRRTLAGLRSLPRGSKALLAGRLCGLFDIRKQQWIRVDLLEDAIADSREHAIAMLAGLERGCLLLFDRGYLSFAWFDELSSRGILWISRIKTCITFRVQHTISHANGVWDYVALAGAYRSDQTQYPVRVIEFWLHGQFHRSITNILDPRVLTVSEVIKIYQRRWDIEMAFRLVKDYLGARHIWSARWGSILTQIWSVLLLAQILHTTQEMVADQAGVDRFDVSMKKLMEKLPELLRTEADPIAYMVEHGKVLGILRPSARKQVEIPFVDPTKNIPPPPEVCQPAMKPARHSPRRKRSRKYARTGGCSSVSVPQP